MSKHDFLDGYLGDPEADPCDEHDRRASRYHGIAEARAKFIDKCWCGNNKHSDRPLCNLCIRVSEVDNG